MFGYWKLSKRQICAFTMVLFLATACDDSRDKDMSDAGRGDDSKSVSEPLLDEHGRWVVMLGEVTLHIPRELRSQPPPNIVYDIFPLALCLQESAGLEDCFDLDDRIQIFLMAISPEATPPPCNTDEDYTRQGLNGPFSTGHAQVVLYKTESGTTRRYVYRESGAKCRQPTARCNALRCVATFIPRPGARVRYEFNENSIEKWPAIHQRVFKHVTSLFAEEE